MAGYQPDEMAIEKMREQQNMRRARHSIHQLSKNNTYALQVMRDHPSQDRKIIEIWGRGTKSEMKKRKRIKEQEYNNDEYTFEIIDE